MGGVRQVLDRYVKAFEVRKRIYTEYDENWKPVQNSRYDYIENYILLAKCVALAYEKSECTKYLNVLLKLDDTLISLTDTLTNHQKIEVKDICAKEMEFVKKLGAKMEVKI